MKKPRFADEQIIAMIKGQQAGSPTEEACRKYGISNASFCKYKAKFGGLDVSYARKLKTLEDGNAKSMQNDCVESFNGSFRDECLNKTLFTSLDEARTKIIEWKEDYNQNRPHSSLGNLTPNEYAMKMALQKLAA